MKSVFKLIAVVVITVIVNTSYCYGSDGDLNKIPRQFSSHPTVQQQPVNRPEKLMSQTPSPHSQSQQPRTFGNMFMSAMIALAQTIGLILAITGAYFIYKKVKAGKVPDKQEKTDITEPKTIEEAISSYIKHKLRK